MNRTDYKRFEEHIDRKYPWSDSVCETLHWSSLRKLRAEPLELSPDLIEEITIDMDYRLQLSSQVGIFKPLIIAVEFSDSPFYVSLVEMAFVNSEPLFDLVFLGYHEIARVFHPAIRRHTNG